MQAQKSNHVVKTIEGIWYDKNNVVGQLFKIEDSVTFNIQH